MANSRKHPSARDATVATVAITGIEQAIADALRLSPDDRSIAIAFSGGLDSTVLLDAAVAVAGAAHCVAIHIHHGLSPHADAWLRHCEVACERRAVRFAFERLDLQVLNGRGVEAAARDARYAALARVAVASGTETILLGQHADDQAETVLLQMLRGAGLGGLAAMPYRRPLERRERRERGQRGETHAASPLGAQRRADTTLRLLRPFLEIDRGALEVYANARQLDWIEDESNADVRYARNALRRDVMPSLNRYFPGYRRTLARTARHAAQARQLCDELAEIDLRAVMVGRALSRTALRGLSTHRALNVLRYWMRQEGLPAASEARLDDMHRQLCAPGRAAQGWMRAAGSQIGTRHIKVEIHHAGHVLRTYRDTAVWTAAEAQTSSGPDLVMSVATATTTAADVGARADEEARFDYESGGIWRLPYWHGELRILEPGTSDAEPASDDGHGCLSIEIDAHVLRAATLSARARVGGERLRIAADRPTRSLKQLFQQAAIAPWQRHVPLFYIGDRLFFVPRIGGYLAEDGGSPESTSLPQKPWIAAQDSGENRRIRLVWVPWDSDRG